MILMCIVAIVARYNRFTKVNEEQTDSWLRVEYYTEQLLLCEDANGACELFGFVVVLLSSFAYVLVLD